MWMIFLTFCFVGVFSFDMVLVQEYTFSSSEYYHKSCYMNVNVNDTEFKEEYVRLDECLPNDLASSKEEGTNYVRYSYIRPDGEPNSAYITRVTCDEKSHCMNPTFWDVDCKVEVLNFGCEGGTFLVPDDSFYIPSDISPGILLSFYSDPQCKQFLKFVYEYVRNESILTNIQRSDECLKVREDYYVLYTPLQGGDWIGRDQFILSGFYVSIVFVLILLSILIFCYQRICVTRPSKTKKLTSIQDKVKQVTFEDEVTLRPNELRRSRYEYIPLLADGEGGGRMNDDNVSSTTDCHDYDEEEEDGEDLTSLSQPKKVRDREDCPCGGFNLLYYPTFLDHYCLQYYCLAYFFICCFRKHSAGWEFGKIRRLPPFFYMLYLSFSSILSFVMMVPISIMMYNLIGTISFEPGIMTILMFVECALILPTLGVRYNLYCLLPSEERKERNDEDDEDEDDDDYEEDDEDEDDDEENTSYEEEYEDEYHPRGRNNSNEVEEKRVYLYDQDTSVRNETNNNNNNNNRIITQQKNNENEEDGEEENFNPNIIDWWKQEMNTFSIKRIFGTILRCKCCFFDRWLVGCGRLFPIIVFPIYFLFWLTTSGYLFVKTIALYSSKMYIFQTCILTLFSVAFSAKMIGLILWCSLVLIMFVSSVIHLFIKLIGGFE